MGEFEDELKLKMHELAKGVYAVTRSFPKDEIYGLTSQLRRAGISVALNYIEGYARFKKKIKLQFYETSYGSLKETKYLIFFCHSEHLVDNEDYQDLMRKSDDIGKMLWRLMQPLRDNGDHDV
ncbi:MAG: four helix bundle protein [Nitrospinae bacterium CG11_big_fil_rev_8_21_14_0_20_56_8]|nr:MAG: four helix bundle protein [Nitrospinae bacterium CG11_big_fil_rev_8_21_14_0_20_56_8]